MYCGVPSSVPTAVSVVCPSSDVVIAVCPVTSSGSLAARRARPKSSTLGCPSSRIITFSGLMSRWMRRARCAAARALAISISQRSRWATSGSSART
ncbi:MAG: hypothetical protein QM820_24680 [Minicystis sp.]